ncbi:uncharacterized protein LOC130328350 [Hyla sarda]|uniref:uncharacterized protein LOC130328350 n=1 Tax=Hyla sarda TaxID=327740 RepID=UPI0024C24E89|nr:uncharacterized protein LOC130328348 isoform X2 [Hyla sarda]XP_056409429.1 uncharacterized protein LOC130328350 [Hyla sarda]
MASASDGDPGMVPSYAKLKNSVRISYLEDQRKNRDLKYIVEQVLLGVFGLRKHEILSIQDYPKRGVYDVTFTEGGIYKDFVIQMKKKQRETTEKPARPPSYEQRRQQTRRKPN